MVFRKAKLESNSIDPDIEVTSVKDGLQTDSDLINDKKFDGEIYVMPREFFTGLKKKKKASRTLVIILIISLVVFAFAIASIYVFVFQKDNAENTQNDGEFASSDTDIFIEEDVSEKPATTTEPELIEIATTTDDIIDEDVKEGGEEFPFLPLLPKSLDFDSDGLTDIEESIIGSDEQVADTDGDSFLDGAELLAGFDPTKAGETLENSEKFQQYKNIDPAFSLAIPTAWLQAEESTDEKKVFLAKNGDTITIELFKNQPPFTTTKWLEDTYPGTDIAVFSQTAFNTFVGLEAQNGRQVIINIDSHIVLITYKVNGKAETGYPTIWEYILKSFS